MIPLRTIRLSLPIRTKSLTNERTHWRVKAARAKAERTVTRLCFSVAPGHGPLEDGEEAMVTMLRVAPRSLDSDNLPPSMKSIRDELAACLGLDDRDPRIVWAYEQRRAEKGADPYAVDVLVEVYPARVRPMRLARG